MRGGTTKQPVIARNEATYKHKPNMKTHYDYPEIIKWLEQKGKTDYGNQFHFREADQNNLSKLIAYYLKDEVVATLFDIDLSKGILLTVPIGFGKTSLVSLMK